VPTVEVGGQRFELGQGDGMTFAGDRRHAYLAVSAPVRFTMAVHEPPARHPVDRTVR